MVVYLAKNLINGKCYVGKSKDLNRRKIKHKSDSLNNIIDGKFSRAIRKYGFQNFIWTILYESSNENDINLQEQFYIRIFDSINRGYNMTEGGDGGNTLIDEEIKEKHRKKIKASLSIKEHSTSKTWFIYDEKFNETILTGRKFIEFFLEKNINHMIMRHIAYGSRLIKNHKGYTCSRDKLTIEELKERFAPQKMIYSKNNMWLFEKQGKKFDFRLREDFCKEFGLTFSQARRITEKNQEINGWKGFKKTIE